MSKFNLRLIAIPLFALISIVSVGCSKSDSDKVTIGVILPLTGDLSSYSDPIKTGLDMALADLNARETDGAKKYELKIMDSQTNQKTAVSALQQMINIDNIKYVIGDVGSNTTLAMVPVAEANEVFLLSPGTSSPKLTGISEYFARNYPSSVAQSTAAAEFSLDELGHREAALIYVNNEYGIGLTQLFEERYTSLGGTISMKESYAFGQTDFRTLIAKIRENDPKLIYLAGNQKEMGNFMRQYGEIEITAQIVSNISFLEPDCLNLAGEAANGVIVPLVYYDPEDASMRGAFEFGEKYKEIYGDVPPLTVTLGYDALKIMAAAIEKSGEENVKQVASSVRNLKNYDGAMGVLNFTDGDVSTPVEFKVVQDGEAVDYQ